jgi:hypothetical protein
MGRSNILMDQYAQQKQLQMQKYRDAGTHMSSCSSGNSTRNSSRVITVAAVALLRAVGLPTKNCPPTAACHELGIIARTQSSSNSVASNTKAMLQCGKGGEGR